MSKDKRSFFERLTGANNSDFDYEEREELEEKSSEGNYGYAADGEEPGEEGQLAVDVYQSDNDIVIQAIVAGVRPEEVDVAITRDSVTIKGRRENARRTGRENFFCQELYWGSFSRTITLSSEIDPDSVEASSKNGILTVKLPLINKNRMQKIKVRES
ncbi:MAG: Hsp20/alpha crystallin family protein [Candidatus Pacebacteria bacterium]|nr:Hsp20/alpha crystallin family protein [Candidatus Paceibacterota bacterium]NUQ57533.1 Hsp20/alpha crystallin family protein [Candidatus Paceibacter sp.]